MALVIRHPRPEEDLSPFFDVERCPLKWNCEQVYVADDGTQLVGIALVFDGGHDVVLVDYVRALPSWAGKGLWSRFLKNIITDMRKAGKLVLLGYVAGDATDAICGMARHLGGHVGKEQYVAVRKDLF